MRGLIRCGEANVHRSRAHSANQPVSRRSLGMVMRVSTEALRLARADLAYEDELEIRSE